MPDVPAKCSLKSTFEVRGTRQNCLATRICRGVATKEVPGLISDLLAERGEPDGLDRTILTSSYRARALSTSTFFDLSQAHKLPDSRRQPRHIHPDNSRSTDSPARLWLRCPPLLSSPPYGTGAVLGCHSCMPAAGDSIAKEACRTPTIQLPTSSRLRSQPLSVSRLPSHCLTKFPPASRGCSSLPDLGIVWPHSVLCVRVCHCWRPRPTPPHILESHPHLFSLLIILIILRMYQFQQPLTGPPTGSPVW